MRGLWKTGTFAALSRGHSLFGSMVRQTLSAIALFRSARNHWLPVVGNNNARTFWAADGRDGEALIEFHSAAMGLSTAAQTVTGVPLKAATPLKVSTRVSSVRSLMLTPGRLPATFNRDPVRL